MQINVLPLLMALMLLFFTGCVEEYWPEMNKYESVIVVDGLIHNGEGPYTITLSRSARPDKPVFNGVANAQVSIHDHLGAEVKLTALERGTYVTPAEFKAEAGILYQLQIVTAQGERYASDFESLPEPVGIDTVQAEVEYHTDPRGYYVKPGVQFYVSTEAAINDSACFYWRLTETFEFHADFEIYYVFDQGILREMLHRDSLRVCYRTLAIPEIFTYNTVNMNSPALVHFPLNFTDTESRRLSVRYSLLIDQYTVSQKHYTFWNSVEQQNDGQGGLYSTQPFQIQGNMHCSSNPEQPVSGNFTVAGHTAMRIFVDPPIGVNYYYPECTIDTSAMEEFYSIRSYPPLSWPVYATRDENGIPALPNQSCMDCTVSGTLEKPDFW